VDGMESSVVGKFINVVSFCSAPFFLVLFDLFPLDFFFPKFASEKEFSQLERI
jgi:hypothetical protein